MLFSEMPGLRDSFHSVEERLNVDMFFSEGKLSVTPHIHVYIVSLLREMLLQCTLSVEISFFIASSATEMKTKVQHGKKSSFNKKSHVVFCAFQVQHHVINFQMNRVIFKCNRYHN